MLKPRFNFKTATPRNKKAMVAILISLWLVSAYYRRSVKNELRQSTATPTASCTPNETVDASVRTEGCKLPETDPSSSENRSNLSK